MSRKLSRVKYGTTDRISFAKIKDVLDIPYFIALQKDSYKKFIETGIEEVFKDFSPVVDFTNRFELHFIKCYLEGTPKYSVKEAKNRRTTYSLPLRVKVRLVRKDTGEMQESNVFMGDLPLMTENGSFIVNGSERVIVSQLVRSPSVYFKGSIDNNGIERYETTVIPNRGAWLEFEQDSNNLLKVSVDRNRKLSATVLLRALGIGEDAQLKELFDNNPIIESTLNKDSEKTRQEATVALYKRLRPGETPDISAMSKHINDIFYDPRRYDLARVGRYKFNKKLCLATIIANRILACDIVDMSTGEVLHKAKTRISLEQATEVQNRGINEVFVYGEDEKRCKVIGNATVDLAYYIDCDPIDLGINEKVYFRKLKELMELCGDDKEALYKAIKENVNELVTKHITIDDIISSVAYNLNLINNVGEVDNIDHLANRRVRSVGELLQNQFRIGFSRLERVIRERMSVTQISDENKDEASKINPQSFINIKPVTSVIKEFFCSSQLSQFMDHYNPIAELTHKRKLSALGPGGLNRERASFDVRDVHHSHYGRMCPIETPEGQNIGLISSLATYAQVNEYGFIESPYRKVVREGNRMRVTDIVEYMPADIEDRYIIAQANAEIEDGYFVQERVTCRFRDDIREFEATDVDYMDVSPKQLVSIAASLIPFLENDDTSRALMGSNMQRQAVPLLKPEAPFIGTGMEYRIAYDSGVCVIAKHSGVIKAVSAEKIVLLADELDSDGNEIIDTYVMTKFTKSNQNTCINQKPIVNAGQVVKKGDVIADGPSTEKGELALGRNVLIGFMSWEGYNYEDAILINEDLVKEDAFTSIHIQEYEIDARDTKLGEEQITKDIPNLSDEALRYLDQEGIVMIGAEVKAGDILVGKVSPKGESDPTPEERLYRAIFGEKAREVRDTSLRVPHGGSGIVVDVKVFSRINKDEELQPGVSKSVRVSIAQKRKISVGDKMAGRHGNKGVISRVLPKEDMPFLEDGTPLQIVLNPLGVPSRMNIGQVLEVHLGYVARMLGEKFATPVFDGASESDIRDLFIDNSLNSNEQENDFSAKLQLYDGRNGEPFENKVTVGCMYMLKLCHLVDDKMHARSLGPYSLVTQQPLGGKAQFGGQRFGEMEVWALEAYGASRILQEILTVKSDDVAGREAAYGAIVKGNNISEPGIPESFKVLIKEFQSLALDIRLLTENKDEIGIVSGMDDDIDITKDEDFGKENDITKEVFGNDDDNFFSINDEEDIVEDSTENIFSSIFSNGVFDNDESVEEDLFGIDNDDSDNDSDKN